MNPPLPDPANKGIWQILPRESASSYDAFNVYLDLLPDGTLEQVAEKTGKSLDAVHQLSSRHSWMERAAAWRHHLAATAFTQMAGKHVENQKLYAMRQQILRQQEWEYSQKISLLGARALDRLLNDPQAKFRTSELLPLLRFASQCGHKATTIDPGLEPERDLDNDPLILEFRANLQKVCGDQIKEEEALAAQAPIQTSPTPGQTA